jgi:hypothetical protein
MNQILEKEGNKERESVERGLSRCLFGDWPRRSLLKLSLPTKDLATFFPVRKEI